jgi:hypothetical protein
MNIDNVWTVPGVDCDIDQPCRGTGWVCLRNKCVCRDGYIQGHDLCIKLPGRKWYP